MGPQASGWAAQENRKETLLWSIEWGSICCSSVRSPTPSHTQPFQIKWEVYFSKDLCRSSLLCHRYDSACMHMYYVAIQQIHHSRKTSRLIPIFIDNSKSFTEICFLNYPFFFLRLLIPFSLLIEKDSPFFKSYIIYFLKLYYRTDHSSLIYI